VELVTLPQLQVVPVAAEMEVVRDPQVEQEQQTLVVAPVVEDTPVMVVMVVQASSL
tara:strand:+ start:845 stop:1012 length:168 start_codon:yes stop_codon:yes gene_type:complete